MKKAIFIFGALICFLAAGYGAFTVYSNMTAGEREASRMREEQVRIKREELTKRKAAWARLKKKISPEISGHSAVIGLVIKDLDTGWALTNDENTPIPSASVVKVPIMMACYLAAEDKKITLDDEETLTSKDKTAGSGLLKDASAGKECTIRELIELMITHSDNTAANMVINILGLEDMNKYFARLGLKHTNLARKMMDFQARKHGVENYTTAHEMAYLLEKLYRGLFINPAVSKRCLDTLANQKVNDRISRGLPEGTLVAHKTGLENGLCHDVGIVYTDKGNFLISIVTKHNYKYAQPMKKMIARISADVYAYYSDF